jgi:hypothetical protein
MGCQFFFCVQLHASNTRAQIWRSTAASVKFRQGLDRIAAPCVRCLWKGVKGLHTIAWSHRRIVVVSRERPRSEFEAPFAFTYLV